ncbi:MAG: DUF4123 domain-containing protein [Acidobacteria bacterium]|nr:DUF4123 domain-containing protein [Acidobacteriota bacterium]
MLTEQMLNKLAQKLFSTEDIQPYAIVDGASISKLLEKLDEYQVECECLFAGDLEDDIAEVAPYLVKLMADSTFAEWLLLEGWGKHWGIFLLTKIELSTLLNHLCKFIRVRDEEGRVLHFRFYDPRVLSKFLPTCTTKELVNFFGEIESFIIETENEEIAKCFSLSNSNLKEDKILLV